MNTRIHKASIILAMLAISSQLFSASYPKKGYMEGPSYMEMYVTTNSDNMLGADYNYDAAAPVSGTYTDLADPYVQTLGGTDYFMHSDFAFEVDVDMIYYGAGSWLLVAPDYSTYPELYGWLVMDLDGSGDFTSNDLTDPPLGAYYDLFFVPIGNGEFILILLILLYATFIVYRMYRKQEITA